MNELGAFWSAEYQKTLPIADDLKAHYPERWIRIHTLPGSKRWPATEEEYEIILDRHNSVLHYLAAGRSQLYLVTAEYTQAMNASRSIETLLRVDPHAQLWQAVSMSQIDPDDTGYWQLYSSEWTWRQGVFDDILRLVADDQLRGVMIVSTAGRWIYHPYDGGADILMSIPSERAKIAREYEEWVSKHPEGL